MVTEYLFVRPAYNVHICPFPSHAFLCRPPACHPGFYKAYAGNVKCSKCPPHSFSYGEGATICRCETGFFRAEKDPPTMACTREYASKLHLGLALLTDPWRYEWYQCIGLFCEADLWWPTSRTQAVKRCQFSVLKAETQVWTCYHVLKLCLICWFFKFLGFFLLLFLSIYFASLEVSTSYWSGFDKSPLRVSWKVAAAVNPGFIWQNCALESLWTNHVAFVQLPRLGWWFTGCHYRFIFALNYSLTGLIPL